MCLIASDERRHGMYALEVCRALAILFWWFLMSFYAENDDIGIGNILYGTC